MIPWSYRWRAWVYGQKWIYEKLLKDHWGVVGLAILGLVFLMQLSIAHCQGDPDCLVMEGHNLRAAENVLGLLGHQIKAYDGVAIGPEEKRARGTALIILRGHNPQGQWFCFAIETEKGAIKAPVKVYPLKRPPVGWKGD